MKLVIGYVVKDGKAGNLMALPWENNIGALVVGRPGSGKSHVIASLITQAAAQGAELAIAEYNADEDNPQSLLYRTQHIDHLLKYPKVTSGDDMIEMIYWLQARLHARQKGKEAKTPLLVVLDEFFQFAATVKPKETSVIWKDGDARTEEGETRSYQKAANYWEILMGILSDLRKNNIRIIIATQEPSSTATNAIMRQARDMFRFKLIMNLSVSGAKLLGVHEQAMQLRINTLKPGWIYVDGMIIGVPYPIHPSWIEACKNKQPIVSETKTYIWTENDLDTYLDALFRYWTKFDTIRIDGHDIEARLADKDALIRFLVLIGKNNEFIKHSIKGNTNDVIRIANGFRAEYQVK